MPPLLCPLCDAEVATASAGCLECRLPMLDVFRHQGSASPSRRRRTPGPTPRSAAS